MRRSRVLLACPHIKNENNERTRENRSNEAYEHVEQTMLGLNAAICRLVMLYYMGNL
jgi:hypothetical protein